MSRHEHTDPLVGEVRFRVPLPILIPLAAVALIALVTIGFSRVLLAIPPEAATAIAFAVALNVLIACAVVALRPRLSRAAMAELAIVVIYPILIGIVIAVLGIGEGEAGGEGEAAAEQQAPVQSGPVASGDTMVAEGLEFSSDEIRLQAGEDATIELDNRDTSQHNIAIYEDDSAAQDIFVGDAVTGDSITYEFTAPEDPGTYFFRCDFHPTTMTGDVVVE